MMALKWGIINTGKVSQDLANVIISLNVNDHKLVAISDSNLRRARQFQKKFRVTKAYDDYLKLAKNEDVEVVYVGTNDPEHLEVATAMLKNNKHVLVENPIPNDEHAKKIKKFAKDHKLFLMEAMWSRLFPDYQYACQQIDMFLGDFKSVEVNFGFGRLNNIDRYHKDELAALLAVYGIQCFEWALKPKLKSFTVRGENNIVWVQIKYGDEMDVFDENDQICTIKISQSETLSNTVTIIGKKGQVTLPLCWCIERTPVPAAENDFSHTCTLGLRHEAKKVRTCIRNGFPETNIEADPMEIDPIEADLMEADPTSQDKTLDDVLIKIRENQVENNNPDIALESVRELFKSG